MCEAENNSDLEEGEIREDVFEDISECSLSDVLSVQGNVTRFSKV